VEEQNQNLEDGTRGTIRIEGSVVGPLKRSTLDLGHPDPEWQALGDLLYWAWCFRLQASRLSNSVKSEFPIGVRPYVQQRKLFATTSYDEHIFLVTAGHLDQALKKARRYLRGHGHALPREKLRALQLLRNVYEHWQEVRDTFRTDGPEKTRSALDLLENYPQAEPRILMLYPDDIVVAGVVSLKDMVADVRRLEAAAHWRQRQLQREGRQMSGESPRKRGVGKKPNV
jgi:hypothetical protein